MVRSPQIGGFLSALSARLTPFFNISEMAVYYLLVFLSFPFSHPFYILFAARFGGLAWR